MPTGSAGHCPLTPRELDLVRGAAAGLSDQDLGDRFGMARQSVKATFQGVFRTLGVPGRTSALVLALQRGWLSLDAITVAPKEVPPRPHRHLTPVPAPGSIQSDSVSPPHAPR